MAIALTENHPRIRDFLNNHGVAVLATANSKGMPHAASVYFVIDDEFNFYFLTKQATTKCANLEMNPNAAMAIVDPRSQTTVQLNGTVTKVNDIRQIQNLFNRVVDIAHQTSGEHHPPVTKVNAGKYVAYRLKPKMLRMAEFVKAEYPPVGNLFEVAVKAEEESLDGPPEKPSENKPS